MIPGEILTSAEPVELNPGRQRVVLRVCNTADRPVQVGSHYHFAEVNPGLSVDRERAAGHRLDIPAGTSVRFEPGVEREVSLVPLAGRRLVPGLWSPVSGSKSGRVLPNRTSGERDASQPQVRDQTGPSFPNVTNTLNSGEAEQ